MREEWVYMFQPYDWLVIASPSLLLVQVGWVCFTKPSYNSQIFYVPLWIGDMTWNSFNSVEMSRRSVVFRQKIFVKNKNNIRKQVTINDWTISSLFVSFKLVVVVGSLITTTALAKFCCKKICELFGCSKKIRLKFYFYSNATIQ